MLEIPQNMQRDDVSHHSKIYHHHIPKCGGTSLNLWIDTQFHHSRCRPPDFMKKLALNTNLSDYSQKHAAEIEEYERKRLAMLGMRRLTDKQRISLRAALFCWENYDSLHGHTSLLAGRRPNTFVFTVLREPTSRAWSLYRDLARLKPEDYAHIRPGPRAIRDAIRRLSFDEVIKSLKYKIHFRALVGNLQCRLLTRDFMSARSFFKLSDDDKANAAIQVLDRCMNFVGIQENMKATLRGIVREVGLPTQFDLPKRNVTQGKRDGGNDLSQESRQWLLDNNRADAIVYAYAKRSLDSKLGEISNYSDDDFEADGIQKWLPRLRPATRDGEAIYDMNMPLFGRGFLERDAAGTEDCARWTTGAGTSIVYVPVKPRTRQQICLYIKGWMDWSESDDLKVHVNDRRVEIERKRLDRGGEAVCCEIDTGRAPWIKLTTIAPPAKTASERGIVDDDPRSKGYLLWRYSTLVKS